MSIENPTPTPLELLETELTKYVRAFNKSAKSYNEGGIDLSMHTKHLENLVPKISAYKLAIRILRDNTE